MKTVSSDDFLFWAKGAGVAFDPRYPESGCLTLLPPRNHARFWVIPGDLRELPCFIGSFLAGIDKWSSGFIWPRAGHWPAYGEIGADGEGIRQVVLQGAGVPAGWKGALRFDHADTPAVTAILFIYLAFGWCVDDDLFVIPDHARQILQTDHHDVQHVECQSEERIRAFVDHMAGEGYELPVAPPDGTFRQPAWMGRETGEL
jgi:hypothetical protein